MTVSPQRVREHIGVEPVIFVTGRAIPAAQRLDLPTRHHKDGKRSVEEHLDHRTITAFDRDPLHAGGAEPARHLGQPRRVVGDVEPVDHPTAVADHARHMHLRRPVHPCRWSIRLHNHSSFPRRSLTRCRRCCWTLTARRSKRMALSPVPNAGPPGLAALLLALEGQASTAMTRQLPASAPTPTSGPGTSHAGSVSNILAGPELFTKRLPASSSATVEA